ncbi:MAG: hypothetical protein A4E68_01734 [Syntrophaceae bacterium PtaB.Bin095]|jgi:hypothetical protein|nr:MAG: hypothetical protein A4E68_01734 [Syntrophaceae bacterium PtaB.Bin095]
MSGKKEGEARAPKPEAPPKIPTAGIITHGEGAGDHVTIDITPLQKK